MIILELFLDVLNKFLKYLGWIHSVLPEEKG